jgi:hypothetical protein
MKTETKKMEKFSSSYERSRRCINKSKRGIKQPVSKSSKV